MVNMTVTALTSLYESNRLNREKKQVASEERERGEGHGDEIKRRDTLRQEMKSKAVTVERQKKQAMET